MSITLTNPQAVAESVIGPIQWESEAIGFVECPGRDLHTAKSTEKDLIIWLGAEAGVGDRPPTFFCNHNSCSGVIETANHELRSAFGKRRAQDPGFNPAPRPLKPRVDSPKEISSKVGQVRAKILSVETNAWWFEELGGVAPDLNHPENHWWQFLGIFNTEDYVWIGGLYDSGKPEHSKNFKTVREWIQDHTDPTGPFISPNIFQPETYSRTAENIDYRKFVVLESDILTGCKVLPVARWFSQFSTLRAVIDSGNKSWHCWFDNPGEKILKEAAPILIGLDCDGAMFRKNQCARLPGIKRGARWQRIIYLNPSAQKKSASR